MRENYLEFCQFRHIPRKDIIIVIFTLSNNRFRLYFLTKEIDRLVPTGSEIWKVDFDILRKKYQNDYNHQTNHEFYVIYCLFYYTTSYQSEVVIVRFLALLP